MFVTHLECSLTGERHEAGRLHNLSQAGKPLLVRYDLAAVRRAVALGINHVETARGYGSSERQLGLVLPTLPREKLIVQTKVAPEADCSLSIKPLCFASSAVGISTPS